MADLFSIIPQADRGVIDAAFAVLTQEAYDDAIVRFDRIINGDCSSTAKAFGRYGAATALMLRFVNQGRGQAGDVDVAIAHYEACLDEHRFGDACLMLGMALVRKMGLLGKAQKEPGQCDGEALVLAERALALYQEAGDSEVGAFADVEARFLEPVIARLRFRLG